MPFAVQYTRILIKKTIRELNNKRVLFRCGALLAVIPIYYKNEKNNYILKA